MRFSPSVGSFYGWTDYALPSFVSNNEETRKFLFYSSHGQRRNSQEHGHRQKAYKSSAPRISPPSSGANLGHYTTHWVCGSSRKTEENGSKNSCGARNDASHQDPSLTVYLERLEHGCRDEQKCYIPGPGEETLGSAIPLGRRASLFFAPFYSVLYFFYPLTLSSPRPVR